MGVYTDSKVQAIASAIREKNGTSTQYNIGEMPNAIKDLHTLQTAEGYPLKYNAIAFPTELEISGNSRQETTTGKNILEVHEKINNSTKNGVTLVINNDKTISLKGIATADTTFQISNNVYSKLGYYRISGLPSGSSLSTYFFNVWYFGDLTTTTTKYFSNENQQLVFTITIKNGTNCNDLLFKPMIEYSTTNFANVPLNYEPYTGGIPAPSPNFPQDIECVKSYNLLDIDIERIKYNNTAGTWSGNSFTRAGITYTYNGDGSFTLNGTATANGGIAILGNDGAANQKEILGDYLSGGISTNIYTRIYNHETSTYQMMAINSSSTPTKIDKSKYTKGYVEIYVNNGTSCNNVIVKPMLSKEPKPYLPYGSIGVRRTGKNLLKLKDEVYTSNGITTTISNNHISINGTATTTWFNASMKQDITLKSGTYTFSIKDETNEISIDLYASDNSRPFTIQKGIKSYTTTLTKDTTISRIACGVTTGATLNLNVNLQIEINSVATDYEPYRENISYIDLQGNEVLPDDEIKIDEKGNVKLVKNWGKVVLDGSEDWKFTTNGNGFYIQSWATSNNALIPPNTYTKSNSLCNYFSNVSRDEIYYVNNGFGVANSGALNIKHEDYVSGVITDFKTWLSQNKPIVYYILAEPQEIELNINTRSLDGENNVELLSELEPSNMKERYVR